MYRSTFLAFVVAFLAGASGASSQVSSATDPYVAGAVGTLLSYRHYTRTPLDDALAEEWLTYYLDSLDPGHMIFLASDVSALRSRASTMDDDLVATVPRLEVAHDAFSLFRERYSDRVRGVLDRLDGPIDLTNDESYAWDRTHADWPATDAQADELWRQQLEAELIESILDGATQEDAVTKRRSLYERRREDWLALTPADNLELYLTALAEAFDPHSAYFAPATSDNFDIEISNSVEGIGATLKTDGRHTVVVTLVPGGPAAREGSLGPGDRIVAVAQADGSFEDVVERRLDDVVKLIRGKKGTDVRLQVWPAEAVDPGTREEIRITRDKVVIEDSRAKGKVETVETADGPVVVGVVHLPSFYVAPTFPPPRDGDVFGGATADVARILETFADQGVEAVVLDLKDNGGGSLDEAIGVSGLFLPDGPVVQVRDAVGRVIPLLDEDGHVIWDGPLVVLTSQGSASASEIVAAALQDYRRAVIVGGASTHGKGTVQTVVDLEPVVQKVYRVRSPEPLGALKVTIQKFYRASGGSTQLRGVVPDVVLPSPWDGVDWISEGSLDDPLPWDEVRPAAFQPTHEVTPWLDSVRARSAARVADDDALQQFVRDRALREELDRDTISLDLEERRAERARIEQARGAVPVVEPPSEAEPAGDALDLPDAIREEAQRIAADLAVLAR